MILGFRQWSRTSHIKTMRTTDSSMKGERKKSGTLNDLCICTMPRWTEVELRVYWCEQTWDFTFRSLSTSFLTLTPT